MSLRLYCAAFPKSGTRTLHRALTESGIRSVHGRAEKWADHVGAALWRAFAEGRDPMFYAPTDEAVTDHALTTAGWAVWPQASPVFLRAVAEYHPEAVVVLPTRDPDAWVASVSRWKDLRQRLVVADLPYLPPYAGARDGELRRWYEGHLERVCDAFARRRLVRYAIDDPDAPTAIGEALGVKLKWWGVENANP